MKISTKLYLVFSLATNVVFAQNAKIVDSPNGTVISNAGGTDIPYSASILDIRSTNKGFLLPRMSTSNRDAIGAPQAGLLVYNTSTNQFNYHNGSSWQAASFGNQWGVNGSILHHTGQVGIGTSTMKNTNTFLTVRGNLGGTNLEGMYIDASSNTGKAFYGYSVNDSSRAYHYYDGNTSKWNLSVSGSDRITVNNLGYVGINNTAPVYRLQVNGSFRANSGYIGGYLSVDDNVDIGGTATVNVGKGVAYNANGPTNLRMFRFTTENFHVVLDPFESTLTSITFAGGFTSTPLVVVGDIDQTGGTGGELDRILLVLRSCSLNTTTGNTTCLARLVNTDDRSQDYSVKWNCIAIGY